MAEVLKPLLPQKPIMIGIHTGGAWVAAGLHRQLGLKEPLGTLDISFYRDDFTRIGLNPQVGPRHCRSTSTAGTSSWSMTSCTPAAPSARP